jgi:hypothetical protein
MNGFFQMQEGLDFAETDQCKPFFLGLSLAKKQFKLESKLRIKGGKGLYK